jgi:hypothetical protein
LSTIWATEHSAIAGSHDSTVKATLCATYITSLAATHFTAYPAPDDFVSLPAAFGTTFHATQYAAFPSAIVAPLESAKQSTFESTEHATQ